MSEEMDGVVTKWGPLTAATPQPPKHAKTIAYASFVADGLFSLLVARKSRKLAAVQLLRAGFGSLSLSKETNRNCEMPQLSTPWVVIGFTAWQMSTVKMLRRRQTSLAFLSWLLGGLEFVSWGASRPDTIVGFMVRLLWMVLLQGYGSLRRATGKALPFPIRASDVTAEWVTTALHESGSLSTDVTVKSVTVQPLSGASVADGSVDKPMGFIGETVRLHLTYDGKLFGSNEEGPSSVVAKFASNKAFQRLQLRGIAVYARETEFYRLIEPSLRQWEPRKTTENDTTRPMLSVPRPLGVAYDDYESFFILLMADASPLKPGDETVGASWELACSVVCRYARFHSLYWSANLDELDRGHPFFRGLRLYDWMSVCDEVMKSLVSKAFPRFVAIERLWGSLSADMKRTLKLLSENVPMLVERLSEGPLTLIHADARVENMLLPASALQKRPAVKSPANFDRSYDNTGVNWLACDWQTTTKGLGVYDISYFVGLDVSTESADDSVDQVLVKAYYEELQTCGVDLSNYSYSQCWEDYRLGVLLAALIPVVVMDPERIDAEGNDRAFIVREAMLRRITNTIKRVRAGDALEALVHAKKVRRNLPQEFVDMKADDGSAPTAADEKFTHHTPASIIGLPRQVKPGKGYLDAYDRWFLNGYSADGSIFFASAMGVYPGRRVVDASFSIVMAGTQHNVRASRRLTEDEWPSMEMAIGVASADLQTSAVRSVVGPISIEVVEPLKKVRLLVSFEGITADVTFTSRFEPTMEPKFEEDIPGLGTFDYQRLTQLVCWDGQVGVHGAEVSLQSWWGVRDRSWGFRPHPTADKPPEKNVQRNKLLANEAGLAIVNAACQWVPKLPRFYWFWCPINLDKGGITYHVQQTVEGHLDNCAAEFWESGGKATKVQRAAHSLTYRTGTRHAEVASIALELVDGRTLRVEIEPLFPFFMSGVGYTHPVWGHGNSHEGEEVSVRYDKYDTELANRMDPLYWHVQEVSKVTVYMKGAKDSDESLAFTGISAMEQLVVGKHSQSGFRSVMDC